MSEHDVKRVDDAGMAAWDSRDVDAWVDLFADSFVWRDITLPEPITTREGAREYFLGWMTAFPDMRTTSINRVVGDDSVGAEIQFTGTNTGPMAMGGAEIPPTGRSVVGKGAYFARINSDGKIVEFSSHPDVAGVMAQLGLMPSG